MVKKVKKGSVTVYLALLLSVLLIFYEVLVTAARERTIDFKTECSMDAAMYSVFAEYNRELLEQYDLLFIDSSYGGGQGSKGNVEAHFKYYLNENFQLHNSDVGGISLSALQVRDLLSLSATDVKLEEYSFATDEKGLLFQRQAVDYVKELYGLNCMEQIKDYLDTAKDSQLFTRDINGEQSANQAKIDSIERPKKKISEDVWEEVPLNNPADAVNGARAIGTLSLVLDANKQLSTQTVALSNYVSHRNCETGSGLMKRDGLNTLEKTLFDKYILEKTNCYTVKQKESLLQYQTEYILTGKDSDVENLSAVANRLLFMRQAANFIHLLSDGAKQAQAEALAVSLAACVLAPELIEPVKWSIIFAWAYAESVYDVKLLFAGGKVPLMKTSSDWHYSLEGMLQFQQDLPSVDNNYAKTKQSTDSKGLDYTEYLGIFLLMQNQDVKVERMMDLIEMDVRKTNGNSNFRLDTCIDYIKAKAVVESGYGYSCEITRDYYYY